MAAGSHGENEERNGRQVKFIFFQKRQMLMVLGCCALVGLFCLLFSKSVTRQGINYQVREIPIPVYLKILNFLDRHFSQQWLLEQILGGAQSDEQKVAAIAAWTTRKVLPQPKDLSIVDDHPWHIVVRGYGMPDQSADVFATLCNAAGIPAMMVLLKEKENPAGMWSFGAVRLGKNWFLFDTFNNAAFFSDSGEWVPVQALRVGRFSVKKLAKEVDRGGGRDYKRFFSEVAWYDFDEAFKRSPRSTLQSPWNRVSQFFKDRKL